jgi:PAS domain S-box-containing protein
MPDAIQPTPVLSIYVVSGVISFVLAGIAYRNLRDTGWNDTIVGFLGIVLGTLIWNVARFCEVFFVGELVTMVWLTVFYVGYGITALSGLFFALAFTGRKRFLRPKVVVGLSIPAVVAVLLTATNEYHELLWVGEFVEIHGWYGDVLIFDREYQPLFYVYMLYTVSSATLGIFLVLWEARQSPDIYRGQTIAFVIGSACALLIALLYTLELQPFIPEFDTSPVGFALMGLFFGFAIFRYRMLDLIPIARDTVIEHMRDGFIVLDTEDRIVDYNDAASHLLGDMGTGVGEAVQTVLPDGATVVEDHEHGSPIESELTVEKDGEQQFVLATVSTLSDGGQRIGRLLLLRDVTEQRAVRKRYRALIENSSDLTLVLEPGGEITYTSPSVSDITGVEPTAIEGMNALSLIHQEDRDAVEATLDSLVERPGAKTRQEYRTYDMAGNVIYLEASIWNLLENPFVEGFVINAREITERKRREQEIREKNEQLTRANEQLDQFAGVISHDLRNPITVAIGHVDIAKDTGREESFEMIRRSLERMEAIIDDVLTLAREGQSIGETETVRLEDHADEAWEHVATEDASLDVRTDGGFEADPDRLLQLFENLFRNAREHAGEDVTIIVGLEDDSLYVADDGPGIPEDRRDEVLEYGHTTNPEGTGLGLSIVSQIAEAHGWDVTVEESDAGGARFEFSGLERVAA